VIVVAGPVAQVVVALAALLQSGGGAAPQRAAPGAPNRAGGDAPPWGGDVNPGTGEKLAAEVHADLLAIVRAPAKGRAAKAADVAKHHASAAIEGWKRFRNPELVELARACLVHTDWHVVHRALHWARCLGDPKLLAEAWPLLDRPETRLREKAVLCCLEAWDDAEAKALDLHGAADVKEALMKRGAAESDPHVRQALLALLRRVDGHLAPRKLAEEVTVKTSDGLVWTPFLRGFTHLQKVAPGVRPGSFVAPTGAGTGALPVAQRWTTPLVDFGKEEVAGIRLQPFGNPRQAGALVHTGQDVGGCMDGAGLYAIGDGIVRAVEAGNDMGTLIVVEHRVEAGDLAPNVHLADPRLNVVYMHAGATVFVAAGESVCAGQLLGTMGLSFSIENGGHFSHLHFGLYPGPFSDEHNYGYKSAGEGTDDWYDPAVVLPALIAASR
jgi:murein DD-endopeptidase MepM/ murein hydrolase activator NlpD